MLMSNRPLTPFAGNGLPHIFPVIIWLSSSDIIRLISPAVSGSNCPLLTKLVLVFNRSCFHPGIDLKRLPWPSQTGETSRYLSHKLERNPKGITDFLIFTNRDRSVLTCPSFISEAAFNCSTNLLFLESPC